MCIMLTIFHASTENQKFYGKVYGILCNEIFHQQKSHRITLDIIVWYGVTIVNIQ